MLIRFHKKMFSLLQSYITTFWKSIEKKILFNIIVSKVVMIKLIFCPENPESVKHLKHQRKILSHFCTEFLTANENEK